MLGEQIRKLRRARGISQVQLAEKLWVSKQAVSNWENNNIMPSVEILIKLAKFFGCSTDFLLELDTAATHIDVTGLTTEEITHLQLIIEDLKSLHSPNSPKENSAP